MKHANMHAEIVCRNSRIPLDNDEDSEDNDEDSEDNSEGEPAEPQTVETETA